MILKTYQMLQTLALRQCLDIDFKGHHFESFSVLFPDFSRKKKLMCAWKGQHKLHDYEPCFN